MNATCINSYVLIMCDAKIPKKETIFVQCKQSTNTVHCIQDPELMNHLKTFPQAVPPQNQADSYKRMEGGRWVFGAENLWVLAPTRHGAHNWEGPGELTAVTALQRLAELTINTPWIESKADANHVVFAGHSMGGHGAW